jgi:hypothetical protein
MRIHTVLALGLVLAPLTMTGASRAAQTDAKADEILAAAREALGGAAAFERIETLSAAGPHRRVMGNREFAGDVTIEIALPDRLRRVEEFGIPGGPRLERVTVLNGPEYWEDSTNRGGGGRMVMRFGGPGGPGGPGGGREPTEEERERFRQMQERRLRAEFARLRLALLLQPAAPVTYIGIAEADDGRADVIEMQVDGSPIRLFVDQVSHAPLMLTYEAPVPRMFTRTPGSGPPSPEEIQRMRSQAPAMATHEMRLDEFREVDGVLLPRVITIGRDGAITEEWALEEVRVNPPLEAARFEKKGS